MVDGVGPCSARLCNALVTLDLNTPVRSSSNPPFKVAANSLGEPLFRLVFAT